MLSQRLTPPKLTLSYELNFSLQTTASKEDKEAELIPKIVASVNLGLEVLSTAYEKLPSVVSQEDMDSDEDESTYQADSLLELKDPYVLRPLPYIINSPQFIENEGVGLYENITG